MENHRKMLLICIWSHIFCNILTWSRKVTTMIDIQVSLTDSFLFSFRSFRTPLILPFSTVPPRKNASAWMRRIDCPHCLLRSLSSPVKQSAAIQITVTYRTWSTCPQQLKAQPLKAGQLKAQPLKARQLKAQPLKARQLKAQPLKARQLKAQPLKAQPSKAKPLKVAWNKFSHLLWPFIPWFSWPCGLNCLIKSWFVVYRN